MHCIFRYIHISQAFFEGDYVNQLRSPSNILRIKWLHMENMKEYYGSLDKLIESNFSKKVPSSQELQRLSDYFSRLGDKKMEESYFRDAINLYQSAIMLDNRNQKAIEKKSACFYWLGDFTEAINGYKEILENNSANPMIHYMIGISYAELGSFEQAIKHVSQAYFFDETNGKYAWELAHLHHRTADDKKALEIIQHYESLPASDLKNLSRLYTLKASIFQANNDFNEAELAYQKAIDSDPSRVDNLYLRGLLRLQSNQTEKAIEDFTGFLSICHNHKEAFYYRSVAFWMNNQVGEAMRDMNAAIYLDKYYLEAWIQKGEIHLEVNEEALARKAFEKALQIDPTHKGAKEKLKQLMAVAGK